MYELIIVLLVFVGVAGLLVSLFMIIEDEGAIAAIGFFVFLVCISTLIYFLATEETYAIEKQSMTSDYGMVTAIETDRIKINGEKTYLISSRINEKFDVDLRSYSLGDVVEIKALNGRCDKYLIEIEKIK